MLTFGSLFSGIGGIDLGLERAGWTCKWQVEIDPFCCKVLEKHWPHVPKFGDIEELTGNELNRVNLLAGGFPCQDNTEEIIIPKSVVKPARLRGYLRKTSG